MQRSPVEPLARAIVRNLILKGVKLLALDFDLTIIGIHTGGAWRGPSNRLAQHVRPCFKALIEAALETNEIYLCIVTYSQQQGTIEDLLRFILPYSDTGKILVQTSYNDWMPKATQPSKQCLGKQQHIAKVITDLYNMRRAVIQPHEILLIDDDEENVNIARHFGHLGYLVREDVSLEDIYRFVEKVKACSTYSSYSQHKPFCTVMCESPNDVNTLASRQAAPMQKREYSAQVYLASSQNPVPIVKQGFDACELSPASTFTIPRPSVTNEQNPRSNAGVKARRPDFDTVPGNGSKTMYVFTS